MTEQVKAFDGSDSIGSIHGTHMDEEQKLTSVVL